MKIQSKLICLLPVLLAAWSGSAAAAQEDLLAQPGDATEPPGQEADSMPPLRMLKLRSGAILWGRIEGHDEESVHVRRLENHGLVRMPWSFLDPGEEHLLRQTYGYVDLGEEDILISVDRLILRDGTEILGVIERRSDNHVFVKRAESIVPVAKALITAASTGVQVPALEVYTKEELYQWRAFELQDELAAEGAVGAAAHVQLARYAERLFDYSHALLHYQLAYERDPAHETQTVAAALNRTREKAERQEQIEVLEEIDRWRARKRYDKALELIGTFTQLFPNTPLLEDFTRLRDRVDRHRQRDLQEHVVKRIHYWTVELARRSPRKAESFEAAIAFLEDGLQEEILAKVIADCERLAPDLTNEEALLLWEAREGGRYRTASYGLGTWLLGESRALAVPGKEEASDPAGSQAEARRTLEERLERYFRNQELTRRNQSGGGPDLEDSEGFWKRWRSVSKGHWALAYFIEYSGLFRVQGVRFANCRECGGTGARHVVYTGGPTGGASEGLVACPICHTLGRVRRLRYR